jgi:threonine aldolase
MSNQIAIKIHTHPGDEVICDQLSHVYTSEGGGIGFISGASVRLLQGDRGRFTAGQVLDNVFRRDDPHQARTSLVVIENTVTRGGGSCWALDEILKVRQVCNEEGLALHLDGARLFNALAATGQSARDIGAPFDTISICLSKGLGAPAGSVLAGSHQLMRAATRVRKVLGGGMRQAGYLAAAGMYALDHNIERLADDHQKAKSVARELRDLPYVVSVVPVETNIVIFRLRDTVSTEDFLNYLAQHDILALAIAKHTIRFVFHLDISGAHADVLTQALQKYTPN